MFKILKELAIEFKEVIKELFIEFLIKELIINFIINFICKEIIIEGSISLIEVIYDTLGLLIFGLTIKDPCKKCLVRACCTDKCEPRVVIDNYGPPEYSIAEIRFYSWLSITIILIIIFIVMSLIIEAAMS